MAGCGQELLDQTASGALMVGAAAFDQRNGTRNDGSLAGADAARELRNIWTCWLGSGHASSKSSLRVALRKSPFSAAAVIAARSIGPP